MSEIKQVCALSPLLFNIVLEFLATVIRQEEEIEVIQIGKKEQESIFAPDMILYIKELKSFMKKQLDTKISFSKVTR
jgi:hypothetical protein